MLLTPSTSARSGFCSESFSINLSPPCFEQSMHARIRKEHQCLSNVKGILASPYRSVNLIISLYINLFWVWPYSVITFNSFHFQLFYYFFIHLILYQLVILVSLQPTLAVPAGQTIECRFLGLPRWPTFWKHRPPLHNSQWSVHREAQYILISDIYSSVLRLHCPIFCFVLFCYWRTVIVTLLKIHASMGDVRYTAAPGTPLSA